MKSLTMKALAAAVLGLAGMGSVVAVCPTDPAAPNGPWASKAVAQGNLAITSPGLNGTNCALQVSLNQNSAAFAKAIVTDNSPQNEPRYRARFYFDTTELTGLDNTLKQVEIFTVSATSSPAGAGSDEVRAVLVGGSSGPSLRIIVADSNQSSQFALQTIPLPVPFGANRFEFDLQQGSTGTVRYWLSGASVATSDASPTGTFNVNNSGWSGAKQASLGMAAASPQYRANIASTQHLYLDEFDSRRQTFIGQ